MQAAILVNLGNTHCHFAAWAEGRFLADEQVLTAALSAGTATAALLASHADWPLVVASVVPAARPALVAAAGHRPITWLTHELAASIDFSAVDPRTIGADRLANAIAARALGLLPAIIVDCGTAITTEVVTADGRFLGGVILPGRGLARKALATGTGQLPDVPFTTAAPPPLGTTTVAAIQAGIDGGLLAAVRHLVVATSQRLGGQGLPAIAVGGDSPYFVQHLDCLRAGPPRFTLHGLAHLAASL